MNIKGLSMTCEVCFEHCDTAIKSTASHITCLDCFEMIEDMMSRAKATTRFRELQRAAFTTGRRSQKSTLQKILMANMRSRQGR